ncbi:MAG: response regulator [Deltaproteobacteria bacterium]|nr:response regulator [Deltaproteobacteria bacterium]
MSSIQPIIMVLDDDNAIRTSLAAFFEDQDWRVFSFDNAEEAFECLKTQKVDAAIVDIRLPGMTGDDFIRNAMTLNTNVVFVIHTGSTDYSMPEDLFSIPLVSKIVFMKPISDMIRLKREIETLLEVGSR